MKAKQPYGPPMTLGNIAGRAPCINEPGSICACDQ
jgi:hypothetical protein